MPQILWLFHPGPYQFIIHPYPVLEFPAPVFKVSLSQGYEILNMKLILIHLRCHTIRLIRVGKCREKRGRLFEQRCQYFGNDNNMLGVFNCSGGVIFPWLGY